MNINEFSFTFDQLNANSLNNSINLLIKLHNFLIDCFEKVFKLVGISIFNPKINIKST